MDCKDCKYFDGYNRDDGTPVCDYGDGYEGCPYCEEGRIVMDENTPSTIRVSIDSEDLARRVSSAFNNSVCGMVDSEIKRLMREEYEKRIRDMTEAEIEKRVAAQVETYMMEIVTIGGGWGETPQELSREDYLSHTIKKALDKHHPEDKYDGEMHRLVESAIKKWSDGMKQTINARISQTFNELTRQNLTDNFVALLMNNESYKQLNNSVKGLLK